MIRSALLDTLLALITAQPLCYANNSALEQAKAFETKRDFKSAVESYEKAATLDPSNPEIRDALVRIWQERLRADPASPETHLRYGRALQQAGQLEQARAEFEQAIRFSPDRANAEASKLLSALPELHRFQAMQRMRELSLITPFIGSVKAALEKSWQPPAHTGLLLTKVSFTVDKNGKASKPELVLLSGSEKEDRSVTDLLPTLSFGSLPGEKKSIDLTASCMSDGKMNMVEVGSTALSDRGIGPLHGGGYGPMPVAVPIRVGPARASYSPQTDCGPWMAEMQRRVKRAWFPPKDRESARVSVIFKVRPDGGMYDLKVEHSSGLAEADEAALKAVQNASPFRPLPPGVTKDEGIQFTFDYDVFGGGGHGVFRQP